nr:hypothetical protein [Tanacetum cinerariifolium]
GYGYIDLGIGNLGYGYWDLGEGLVIRNMVLSYDESKSKRVFERAFMTLFGQDYETFTSTMFLYVDQLQNQLDKDEFQEDKSMAAFWVLNNQFQKFIDWQYFLDYDSEITEKLLLNTLESKLNSLEKLYSYIWHTGQFEPSSDTYLLEKVDSNTTSDLTNMCHGGGEIDRDAEQDQVKSSLLKVEFLKMNDMVEKEVYIELSNRVLQLEKHSTPHYLPKVRKYVFVNPNHVIASGSSRNSSKESYGSNDMDYNYYLEKIKKKIQDKNMNLKPSVMHTTSLQNTTNGRKPKPRSNNLTSRSLHVSKSSYGMSNVQASLFNDKMAYVDNTSGLAPQRKERFSPTPYVPPSKKDYEILFQPLFDEYFNPPPCAVSLVSAAIAAPRAIDPAGSPS